MRLKSIKLSGFKSFVDPTTLPLRNNLIGVVGPNGCGKSNIIDALRWVLGESSARQLRGDALADVIFSGSSGRKPVGQASVELVFDNSDGSLTGSYGQYGEISVRRQATRDGQSIYFLNGTRCRRRDVTDLFLGTGLGPRSYAIIEQGMIARLIEARPEELRNFIEEAAGISRYKERRRETETRIRHTRENMERVADLQQELARRLAALKRQAETAERFGQLKAELRIIGGQLFTLDFAALKVARGEQQQLMAAAENEMEARRARQTSQQQRLEQLREQLRQANVSLATVQQKFYESGAEIARHEQAVKSAQEALQRLEQRRQQLQQQRREIQRHVDDDAEKRERLETELTEIEPQLVLLNQDLQEKNAQFSQAQANEQEVAERRALRQRDQQDAQRREQQQSKLITQQEQRLQRLVGSQQRLQNQLQENAATSHDESLDQLKVGISAADQQLTTHDQAITTIREGKALRAGTHQRLVEELDQQRTALQVMRGQQASLQSLLLENRAGGMGGDEWLGEQGFNDLNQLVTQMRVEPGWEEAVERVLGGRVSAWLVESLSPVVGCDVTTAPSLSLVETDVASQVLLPEFQDPVPGIGLLLERIDSTLNLDPLFAGCYAADSLTIALENRQRLSPGSVLVTPEGVLVGNGWIELPGAREEENIIERTRRLTDLEEQISAAEVSVKVTAAEVEQAQQKLESSEAELRQLQQTHQQVSGEKVRLEGEVAGRLAEQERQRVERLRVAAELDHLQNQIREEQQELATAKASLELAQTDLAEATAELAPLVAQQREASELVAGARTQLQSATTQHRELETAHQRSVLELDQLRQGSVRWLQQLEKLAEQQVGVDEEITAGGPPVEQHQQALQQALAVSGETKEALATARKTAEELEQQMREADQALQGTELQIQAQRETLEAMRLKEQELRVRESSLEEQASRDGYDLLTLLPDLEESWDKATLKTQQEKLEKRIDQLGAINLAAIDEHRQVDERKSYLDDQQADLEQALATMTDAINRIDRETRGRFRDTFDKVNGGLQTLFPQLFGGGNAELELVGDDLLSAGVAITAQPPGKRNSSIQLLSGGEKALTAIALVFAIFQLNPAPFCVLDEVDAPLDDANVDRFCAMVRQMSDQVQFVFVTHNKATMELAQQLSGVTMGEPGVSRLVAVDVDEAVRLVGV
ncbi:MAG: chromosome segregation protein SMC [Immundisolibacteraceae bacterium]|nr:chromosome segregation protein SMC [Immundisolibacteraceae bacterium]